jgi:LmbE family N-acetylglucosaminyl deacetylase
VKRRRVLAATGLGALAAAAGAPLTRAAGSRLKVIVVGGHPDDPESIAGGTMALFADQGHDVVALYLTRGEAGITGKTHDEAATIRSAEAQAACAVLKARARFAGQIDGATEVSTERYREMRVLLAEERPTLVITHWPIDTHRDHRAASLLVYDAWLASDKGFGLFYTEAMTGAQTQGFAPTHYVDISADEPRKRRACFAHASQDPAEFYSHHEKMHAFRGLEAGCALAEAFARHPQDASAPGLPERRARREEA